MFRSFRIDHAARALEGFEQQSRPLDQFLNQYFRANHAIGSKDRKEIGDLLFDWMKWKSLIEFITPKSLSAKEKITEYLSFDPTQYINDSSIPDYIRACCPKVLFELLSLQYGEKKAMELAQTFNGRAPLTVRVNAKWISRDALLQKFSKNYRVRPCPKAPCGIIFDEKVNIHGLDEWKEGLIELQDEASQLIAGLVTPRKGENVLDYCAGGGGKSLAIAASNPSIHITLFDKRSYALEEAKKRFFRGGLPLYSILSPQQKENSFDWLLLDVPCSGSGTYRRNPDLKWKFSRSFLDELLVLQKEIFYKATPYLKSGGYLVYATCSILKEENEEQIASFLQNEAFEIQGSPFCSLPSNQGMDGFFGCVLKKK